MKNARYTNPTIPPTTSVTTGSTSTLSRLTAAASCCSWKRAVLSITAESVPVCSPTAVIRDNMGRNSPPRPSPAASDPPASTDSRAAAIRRAVARLPARPSAVRRASVSVTPLSSSIPSPRANSAVSAVRTSPPISGILSTRASSRTPVAGRRCSAAIASTVKPKAIPKSGSQTLSHVDTEISASVIAGSLRFC
jgi:hypothetical protein